ncbi:MAG: hypothetical protein WB821_00175 [Burkholderiaceae bacterium]
MFDSRQELAVLNNVYWYQAMFRAHRLADAFDDLMWSSEASPPPFHSNLVVLSPAVDMRRVRERLNTLERTLSAASFSMKDSFASLDLAAFGYEVLFEAKWIWHEPLDVQTALKSGDWTALTSPGELEAWENAWWGDARNALAGPATKQFPSSLLESLHHRFFAKWDGATIVAGAIANRSPGVVGLSNTFRLNAVVFDDWTGLMQRTSDHFPGVPMVGYERGGALDVAMAAGFVPTGALRIWQRAP